KAAVEFIGPVDRQIELRRLLQSRQGNAGMLGKAARRFRCRYADHIEPRLHLGAEKLHEMRRRRARAEPERHARTHEFERGHRGRAFLIVAQTPSPPSITYLSSVNSSTPWRDPSRPMPDCFIPPNGATSVEIAPAFTPTMP